MAICPTCCTFQDDGVQECTKCGLSLALDQSAMGEQLLDTVPPPSAGLRPVEVIWVAAAIPVVWTLVRIGIGAPTVRSHPEFQVLLPILGGISLGGLGRMLWTRGQGYLRGDAYSWWVAASGALALPGLLGIQRLVGGDHSPIWVASLGSLAHGVMATTTLGQFLRNLRARRMNVPALGSLLSLAWILAYMVCYVRIGSRGW